MARTTEVRAHQRDDGTSVRAHQRAVPDSTDDISQAAKQSAKDAAEKHSQSTDTHNDGPLGGGLSPSSAAMFRQCPRRWQHRYIDRLPDPSGEPALRGTFVHEVLERLMSEEPSERTIDRARSLCREAWPDFAENEDFRELDLNEKQEREFRWDAWANVERYFEMESPSSVDVVSNESDIRSEIGGVPFSGVVDLVEQGPNGLRVTDYKTGKAPSSRYLEDRLAQVWLYAAALRESGTDVQEVRLMYLSRDTGAGTDFCRSLDQGAMNRAVDDHRETWDNIEAAMDADDFPTKPGPLCSWCAYRTNCPAGKSEHQRRHGYEG